MRARACFLLVLCCFAVANMPMLAYPQLCVDLPNPNEPEISSVGQKQRSPHLLSRLAISTLRPLEDRKKECGVSVYQRTLSIHKLLLKMHILLMVFFFLINLV